MEELIETLKTPLPKDLDSSDIEDYRSLLNANLDIVPLKTIALMCIDDLFGEQINSKDENLFLTSFLDETESLQAELAAKLSASFEDQGYLPPDSFNIQVFRRRAGYNSKELNVPGKYTAAFCLKDFQCLRFDGQDYIINESSISPCFEFSEVELKRKGKQIKYIKIPYVPKNHTQISLKNGKATIKPRDYLSVLAWGFWSEYPIRQKETGEVTNMEELMKDIKDRDDTQINNQSDNQNESQNHFPGNSDEEILLYSKDLDQE